MKKVIASLFTVLLLTGVAAAEKSAPRERFYGKVVSVDQSSRNLTVHNAKKKQDATFHWDEKTGLTKGKQPIPAADLKVGQSLIVSYVSAGDVNRAMKITVRTPFKKSESK